MRRTGFLAVLCALAVSQGCAMRVVEEGPKKSEPIMVPAGTQIPALGLAFDVAYDQSTDGVIPGYRILTVAITNNSLEVVAMDTLGDRWWVVDRNGRKHQAILSLRRTDPDAWSALPVGLKKLIEYPLLLPIAETQPIDLLFKEGAVLQEFREVVFLSSSLGREIRIYPRG